MSSISGVIPIGLVALAIPSGALAQSQIGPRDLYQKRCIEAFAETDKEKAVREAIGEISEELDTIEEISEWYRARAIEVFGSEEAARIEGDEIEREKYRRRFSLLRKGSKEGHLPSLYLLASRSHFHEALSTTGVMTREEILAAYRTLYDYGFPLAATRLSVDCFSNIPEMPEDWRQFTYAEKKPPEMAAWLAEDAVKREVCLGLLREAAFRGDTRAWERLAGYNSSHPTPPVVGIVPPVEHYAWLELRKLVWRELIYEDKYNVPRMQQDSLVDEFLSEDERREALTLAKKYAEVIWPRRIVHDGSAGVCLLKPQFAGDPKPYGPDPSPR